MAVVKARNFCSHVKDAALDGLLKMQTKLEVDAAEVSGNPDLELEYVKEYQDMLQCVNEAAERKVDASVNSMIPLTQ